MIKAQNSNREVSQGTRTRRAFGFTVSVDAKCRILITANYMHWVWNKLKASSNGAWFSL